MISKPYRFALLLLLIAPAAFAQNYQLPFLGEDMEPGERLFTGDHAPGIQGEGEDIGVMKYQGNGKWTPLKQGDGSANSDFLVYGKPIHAISDGNIVGCWRNAPENPKPPAKHEKFVTGTRLVGGNPVEIGRIPGGGNMLFVDNSDGTRTLYAHMIPGSIPAELCPNNDALFPTDKTLAEGDAYLMLAPSAYVAIHKGQFLGKAGNSGSASGPHLHIHTEKGGMAAVMRFEGGLSKPFSDVNTDIQGGWTSFAGQEIPDGAVLIRPPRATPYRMVDFETFQVNGKITYVGIFKPGTYGPMALFESDWNRFLAGWKDIEAEGYRMKDFESYQQNGRQVYAGIFAPGSYGPMALFQNSWQAFLDGWKAIEAKGYRLKDLEVFKSGGSNTYAGIFEPGTYGPMALFQDNWNAFLAGWKDIEGKGYRIKDLEIYQDGSKTMYAGIFAPGQYGPMALFKNNWNEFLDGWRAIEAQGYRMADIEVVPNGNGLTYAGIFEPGTYNPAALFISDWDAFLEAWQALE